jgi:predicted nucleotidyltransferase
MNNFLNEDFQDFLKSLNKFNVKYLLVGGYSVIVHGHHRTTGDMDLWLEQSKENYLKLKVAYNHFGMSLFDMDETSFLANHLDVFSFGRSPVRIDILTVLKGLNFEEAYTNSEKHFIDNIEVKVIRYEDLIEAKRATGRHKDLDDIEQLEKIKNNKHNDHP